MQINVVKDPTGKVIATFESAAGDGAQAQPVLPAGHTVEKLDVDEKYSSNLGAIYK